MKTSCSENHLFGPKHWTVRLISYYELVWHWIDWRLSASSFEFCVLQGLDRELFWYFFNKFLKIRRTDLILTYLDYSSTEAAYNIYEAEEFLSKSSEVRTTVLMILTGNIMLIPDYQTIYR